MISRALLFAAGLSIPTILAAQTSTVHGVVTDTAGQPILFARVLVSDSVFVSTGITGAYSLRVPSGSLRIYVEAPGHERDSAMVEVASKGETVAHFTLIPSDPYATRWYGCSANVASPLVKCFLPVRLGSQQLWVTDAGHWVFRTREEWEAFWAKYWSSQLHTRPPRPPAPEVNWQQELLVAVGKGSTSGCDNSARYVNRVVLSQNATEVVIGPEERGIEITCQMVVAPVDVIVIPRGPYGPVRLRELDPVFRLPPP